MRERLYGGTWGAAAAVQKGYGMSPGSQSFPRICWSTSLQRRPIAVSCCTSCTGASVHEALNRRQLVIVEKAGQRSGGGVATVTRLQTDRRESQLLASAVGSPIALQSGQRQADSGELFNWERVGATGRVTGTGRNAIPKSQPPLHTTGLELHSLITLGWMQRLSGARRGPRRPWALTIFFESATVSIETLWLLLTHAIDDHSRTGFCHPCHTREKETRLAIKVTIRTPISPADILPRQTERSRPWHLGMAETKPSGQRENRVRRHGHEEKSERGAQVPGVWCGRIAEDVRPHFPWVRKRLDSP